ncbi:MAG TPA: Stp1/IreP family PP2C-type Ser/Thr phosphatase [Myxococcota bacterium]|jgi:serine/threonine protein phosphatase PrpC|nr:Stp1/IreP family PP2C-type Ser/Thr phosphatase [Myxococcota bacterium]
MIERPWGKHKLRIAGRTNVGMKRTHNEDSFFLCENEALYLVADGMGGHASGEVASKMAVESVSDFFTATKDDDEVTWPFKMDKARKYEENRLITAIKLANLRIFESAQADAKYKGMGTTIVSIFFANGSAYVCHVGDSRVYRFRGKELTQLTEDHSLLNDYIKMKKLTPEEIENFPHKNVIVRALGMKETVQVDILTEHPRPGDIYLLCSDGLSGMVTDPTMGETVGKNAHNLDAACDQLIATANENGGIDNVTVVLAQVT